MLLARLFFIGCATAASLRETQPIPITRSDALGNSKKRQERPRSMPCFIEEPHIYREGSSRKDWYLNHPSIRLTVNGQKKKLYVVDVDPYTGGDIYYDPTKSEYYEIHEMKIDDTLSRSGAPMEYWDESVEVSKMLSGDDFFPKIVEPFRPFQDGYAMITEFTYGVTLENLFWPTDLHPFPWLMQSIRDIFLDEFPFYLANLITIFEILGGNGIFYGDVRAHNILLRHDGYLQLKDLRHAFRPYVVERSKVYAAMPWVPPEVRNGEYNGAYSPLYSLGALVYELASRRKFNELFFKTGKLKFPKGFDISLKSIILKLLEVDYGQRSLNLEEIKSSTYFGDLDWEALRTHRTESPILLSFK